MVKNLDRLFSGLDDSDELLEMLAEEGDESGLEDLQRDISELEKIVAGLEFRRMFSGEMDACNAYVDIQAGSGGTEAQDWAEMMPYN